MAELERITGQKGLREATRSTWKEIAPKILAQAHLEANSRSVDSALKSINNFEGVCCLCVVSDQ